MEEPIVKISIDHVTNSSSESFGTAITDTVISIAAGIPFIAVTLGLTGTSDLPPADVPADVGVSADPEDPAGTIICTNPDGSVTKTLPDGTVGTKMPDGTVYVNTADGTTGVISPDGTEKYTSPDGTVTEIFTDGTSYTVTPAGSTCTEYPDGTTRVTTPDGGMTLQRPDGSFELKEPGQANTQICGPDGSLLGVRDANGGEVFKDKSGNYSGKMITSDGMELEVKGSDHSEVTLTNPNGTEIVIDKNGELQSGHLVMPDGQADIGADGQITGDFTDQASGVKTHIETTADGSLKISDSAGTHVTVSENGVEGTIVTDDGTVSIDAGGNIDSKDKDGSSDKIVQNPDGTSRWTHKDPDGSQTTVDVTEEGNFELKGSDGTKETLVTNADGSSTLTQVGADGSKTTYVAGTDGKIHITTPEGGHVTVSQDGSVTMAGTDGQTRTFSADDVKSLGQQLPGGEQ